MEILVTLVVVVGVVVGVAAITAWVNVRSMPWSKAAEAERKRQKKWESHYVEFLSYGYDECASQRKANARMEADARAAETVLDKKGA